MIGSTLVTAIITASSDGLVMARRDGSLPWRNGDDLRWFSLSTAGSLCVLGRSTYESMRGSIKTPRGRRFFVLCRQPVSPPGGDLMPIAGVGDVDALARWARRGEVHDVVVCGGPTTLRLLEASIDCWVLTAVRDEEVEADGEAPRARDFRPRCALVGALGTGWTECDKPWRREVWVRSSAAAHLEGGRRCW